MNSKYLEVRDTIVNLKKIIEGTGKIGGVGNLHFDMLQVMGQLDLNITKARRPIVKGTLAPPMQDRLTNKESGHDKIRERDRSNTLLASNTNTLVREERKSTFNLE